MGDWAEAARSGPVHDLIIVVASSGAEDDAARWRVGLAGRRGRLGGEARIVGVDEPPSDRRGNLGGTLRAWEEVGRVVPGLDAWMAAGASALMLHAAGAASRSVGWVDGLGRRGRLVLPGRWQDGSELRLLDAVALLSSPLSVSNPGGVVDVAWTSQILLPAMDPWQVRTPRHDLTKLVSTWDGPVGEAAARELGWFGLEGDEVVAYAPGGTFADAEALAAWPVPRRSVDVGTFRLRAEWLPRGIGTGLGKIDLDPGLTGPVVGRREQGPLAAMVAACGRPTVGVLALGSGAVWLRMRREAEVQVALRAMREVDGLRLALGVD